MKNRRSGEYETPERCFIKEVTNDDGDEDVSIARARVPPRTMTSWHRLDTITERYIISSGRGRVELGDGDPVDVGEGDVVRVPPGTRQRITNTGTSDLVFHCVCTPRFEERFYRHRE